MNTHQLLAQYERIADTRDTIPRLRRFILHLAVCGKLVAQDPDDEPAPLSLGPEEGRPQKRSPIRSANPAGWSVARVGALLEFRYGKGLNSSERRRAGPVPVFGSNGIVAYCETPLTDVPSIIVGRKGSAGALNLCDGPSWTTDVAYFVEAPDYYNLRYLLIGLQALDLGALGKGVKPGLSRSDAYALPLCVPPLAEQRRIVAKVDELMVLCDRLEAARAQREAQRDRLGAASLARLNAPDPDPRAFRDHAAFALDNLARLTTRGDQIAALRQTILNLAVRGKLVAPDPNDESAAELLERVKKAKARRKEETGDTRIRAAPGAKAESLPFALPKGWSAESFENLFLFIDYRGRTPEKTSTGVPLITARNVRMGCLTREPREYVSEGTFTMWMTRGFPRCGDLFFTTEAPLGNVCVNGMAVPFALAQRVICMQPYGYVNTRFVMFALMSDPMQRLIEEHATGLTAKGVKAAKLKPLPIPIPPLAEQARVVGKVDELMTACGLLEGSLGRHEETGGRLLDSTLQEAWEAPAEVESWMP